MRVGGPERAPEGVYLDHNAATPLRPEVRATWQDALERFPANPSSLHGPGRAARAALDEARERVAGALAVDEDEVLFTSGGTEANNLALRGALAARPGAGLALSAIEHSSVYEVALDLAAHDRSVHWVPVDSSARQDVGAAAALDRRGDVGVIVVAAANGEVGTRADWDAWQAAGLLGRPPSHARPLLFADTVQALGKTPLHIREWGLDLASLSPHKAGGPRGVGVLFLRAGTSLAAQSSGGGQEGGLRPGTENVAAIVAAAHAVELAQRDAHDFERHTRALTAELWQEVHTALPSMRLLGPPLSDHCARLPNTLAVWEPGLDGRVLVTRLDLEGLQVSAGSACSSGSLEPSHVLRAMGLDDDGARGGLRMSLGRTTTRANVESAVEILRRTLGRTT